MNIYAIIILTTLLVEYILELISNELNLKALHPELPDEFDGIYDAEAYRKSQEYTRVNTKFGYLVSTFDLVVVLVFWFTGGFNYLDQMIRGWQPGFPWTGLIYMGILIIVKTLLSLPFSIYGTFVIEERFGFNKTTVKTYILDLVKGFVLGIAIGAPLLVGILAFFQYAGALAWLYCWLVVTVVSFIIQFIAPTWILPLFNKFTPLESGELKDTIMTYARSVKYSLQGIFVIDGSRRTSKSNAYFTGFGKNKRIALYDTLIEKHTVPELVCILAHEIGHYQKKHILQSLVINILHTGLMFYLLSIFISHEGLFQAFYLEQPSIYAGLIFFGMLYAPIELILAIFMQIFSRKNEYQADRFAAESTGNPRAMIDALKKLSLANLMNLTPHPFYVFLNYSHPPILERIKAIRHLAQGKK